MPIQAPQWTEYLSCPVCYKTFNQNPHRPISLACGHTVCKTCLDKLHQKKCPFDQNTVTRDIEDLPANFALLQLVDLEEVSERDGLPEQMADILPENHKFYVSSVNCIKELALYLKPGAAGENVGQPGCGVSRPLQRKLVTLVNCQLIEEEGRTRAMRAIRSLGERIVTELILHHQNPQRLSANLWAAVRARGCQFLGPGMQEEVLKLILLALEDGSALSRKILVLFVVQRLEVHYPHASKTAIGHVVQLLYRASCFKVTKREEESSLMQLKEEFRTYDSLRREHDSQIVQIALEAGMRIAPDQWSSLLYGDSTHKSHMQSIIDKLQTPQSFSQSVSELVIALQRSGDPCNLQKLKLHFEFLANIDPNPDVPSPSWENLEAVLKAGKMVMQGLVDFINKSGGQKKTEVITPHNARYKTSICRDLTQKGTCPRGVSCTYAHSNEEMERYRSRPQTMPVTPGPHTELKDTQPAQADMPQPAPADIFPETHIGEAKSETAIPAVNQDNGNSSWADDTKHSYPLTTENGVGMPKVPYSRAEVDQSFVASPDMMSKNMQPPLTRLLVPTHHNQASVSMYAAPTCTTLAGVRYPEPPVPLVYQQSYPMPQAPPQFPGVPYRVSNNGFQPPSYHLQGSYIPRVSAYQEPWNSNKPYHHGEQTYQPLPAVNVGSESYIISPQAPTTIPSQGPLMKLHQRRNELLAQLQQQKVNPSQNNRKSTPTTTPIFPDGKQSQNVQLAKSVTDMIVASRTMSSLIDNMEKTQERKLSSKNGNLVYGLSDETVLAADYIDNELGLGGMFSNEADDLIDRPPPISYPTFSQPPMEAVDMRAKAVEVISNEAWNPETKNVKSVMSQSEKDSTYGLPPMECETCHSRMMWRQPEDSKYTHFPDLFRDEDEMFIPFDPPLVSRFGPISRSARSKYKTSDPVQVTADEVMKRMTPVASIIPVKRPYPSSAPSPSRYPEPSQLNNMENAIVPPYKTDPVLVNPFALPELQQYMPARRKEQTKQEVMDLHQRAQNANTEDQRLNLELQAVELQISMKTGKTPEMEMRLGSQPLPHLQDM
ncbi:hypothetical protein ScPMuIL_010904 [Solemya velum]